MTRPPWDNRKPFGAQQTNKQEGNKSQTTQRKTFSLHISPASCFLETGGLCLEHPGGSASNFWSISPGTPQIICLSAGPISDLSPRYRSPFFCWSILGRASSTRLRRDSEAVHMSLVRCNLYNRGAQHDCARNSAQAACTPHERGAAAILQRDYNAKHAHALEHLTQHASN